MTDAEKTFNELLAEQVGNELAAHQQYIAIAAYYDAETLPRLASFFYRQSLEERDHAMMMIKYMLDADVAVEIPGLDAPRGGFADIVEPVDLALAQERRVSEQINALAAKARDEGNYQGEQFMQWFIKEQVEEVATASDLLKVVERAREHPLQAEEYLAREGFGNGGDDPTAPTTAGG